MAKTEDILFEHELKERLNAELDSAEIFVSEDLLARTLKAVQSEECSVVQLETGATVQKPDNVVTPRRRKVWNSRRLIARIGTVAAAGIILVVGLYAFRMTTMKSKEGQNEMSMAPQSLSDAKQEENGTQESELTEEPGVVFGFVGTGKNGAKLSEATDAVTADAMDEEEVQEIETTKNPLFAADTNGLPGNAFVNDAKLSAQTPTKSNEAPSIDLKQSDGGLEHTTEDAAPSPIENDGLSSLLDRLEAADRVTVENGKETMAYLFWLTDEDGTKVCYRITLEGEILKAKILPDGSQGEFWDDAVIATENDREAVKRWLENQKLSS